MQNTSKLFRVFLEEDYSCFHPPIFSNSLLYDQIKVEISVKHLSSARLERIEKQNGDHDAQNFYQTKWIMDFFTYIE